MIVGLGQCIIDETGEYIDMATGELCLPDNGGDKKSGGRDDSVLREIDKALRDILKTIGGSKAPGSTTVPAHRKPTVVVSGPPVQQQPPVGAPPRSSDLIPGVPNFLLFGGFAFVAVVALAMVWQRR